MTVIAGARVFDGRRLRGGLAVALDGGRIDRIAPAGSLPADVALAGGILAPAFLDLQVNGGGGAMVGAGTDAGALDRLCALHLALGSGGILPTLITDTPDTTARVLAAGAEAARRGTAGFLGLHLEGPHLDPRRRGAHDPALIRPMTDDDAARLAAAAGRLPRLMVTLAPEAVTPAQIARLSAAGVIVSLGHTDCTAPAARRAIEAGARCATHLFNAMSAMGSREPGLVGTVLAGDLPAGLIADGIHVAPEVMRVALAARRDGIFLVSDAMAFAGSEATEARLNGRRVLRREGRLTLEDGTLAGADLTLPGALRVLRDAGVPLERALAMATRVPAAVIGAADRGRIGPGARADLVHLDDGLRVRRVWSAGAEVAARTA